MRQHARKNAVLFLSASLLTASGCGSGQHQGLRATEKRAYRIDETRLGPVDTQILTSVFSRDGHHLAYVARRGRKLCVVVDAQPCTEYDDIDKETLFLGGDGRHTAYEARNGATWAVVADGVRGPWYSGLGSLLLSPNGNRVAYTAFRTKRSEPLAVVDGKEGPTRDGLGGFLFSSDGNHLAYIAASGHKLSVVLDGNPGEEYDGIAGLVFSPNSERLAYAAKRGSRWRVVADGKAGTEYEGIGGLIFSPNSQHLAYVGAYQTLRLFDTFEGGRLRRYIKVKVDVIVVDGQPGPEYQDPITRSPIFSPDSKRVAFVAQNEFNASVIVDGKAGPEYNGLSQPVFSPDGKHLIYSGRNLRETSSALASFPEQDATFKKRMQTENGTSLAVVDGQRGPDYIGHIDNTVFSPDSSRIAFVVTSDDSLRGWKSWGAAIVDGKSDTAYCSRNTAAINDLAFSPDSKHVAYAAGNVSSVALGERSKGVVVVDGTPGAEYDGIIAGSLNFSPDSEHVAYGAWRGTQRFVVVDDSKYRTTKAASPPFGVVLTRGTGFGTIEIGSPVFSPDGTLEFLAVRTSFPFRASSLWRVKYTYAR